MFVNFTNHPSTGWGEKQLLAAQRYGEVQDVAFPDVPPGYSAEDVAELAQRSVREILSKQPTVVLCQGEMTLTYQVVRLLLQQNVTVVAACTERRVCERIEPDGTVKKRTVFEFAGFRSYEAEAKKEAAGNG
jgi:hypothetical protein